MKIAFIHDHPFCEKNGLFYSTSGLPAAAWNRYLINGDKLFVFGRTSKLGAKSLSSRDNVKFHLTTIYNTPKDLIVNRKAIVKELQSFIADKDCVILRVPSILGLLGCQIAIQQNKPYLLEVVADAYDSYRHYGSFLGLVFAPLYDRWTRKIVAESKYTLYVTQKYLQERYPNNFKQLACTNAVIEPVSDKVLDKRIEKIKNRRYRKIVCGEIGDVSVKFKGCHIMLQAMKILKEEGIEIEFHVVGGGSPLKNQKLAHKLGLDNNFFFDGFVPHDKIAEFYDNLDVYVHPSFQEGLPRVVVEAISRGCPCAVSTVAGTPELVEKKYLHKPGDAKKLAQDIKNLVINKEETQRVAKVNFNHAKEYYAPELDEKRRVFYMDFFNSVKNEWKRDFQ